MNSNTRTNTTNSNTNEYALESHFEELFVKSSRSIQAVESVLAEIEISNSDSESMLEGEWMDDDSDYLMSDDSDNANDSDDSMSDDSDNSDDLDDSDEFDDSMSDDSDNSDDEIVDDTDDQRAVFERLIREIMTDFKYGWRITPDAIDAIHESAEQFMSELFRDALIFLPAHKADTREVTSSMLLRTIAIRRDKVLQCAQTSNKKFEFLP